MQLYSAGDDQQGMHESCAIRMISKASARNQGGVNPAPEGNGAFPRCLRAGILRLGITVIGLVLLCAVTAVAQQASQPQPGTPASKADPGCEAAQAAEAKRLFGIVPNFRTSPCLQDYKPLTAGEKFKIARQDAFDRGTFLLAAAFAGFGQLTNSNPSFGQGVAGYASYLGTSYADYVIGDFMTEGIYPSLLHQDPRYFRRGRGGAWSRVGYAAGQIFWTHNDSGTTGFNFSEVLGNASAVAISMSYYADNRNATDAGTKLVSQLGVDAASNVLKEFWPEIERGFRRKPKPDNK